MAHSRKTGTTDSNKQLEEKQPTADAFSYSYTPCTGNILNYFSTCSLHSTPSELSVLNIYTR